MRMTLAEAMQCLADSPSPDAQTNAAITVLVCAVVDMRTELETLCKERDDHAEQMRVVCWHATYNAALGGTYAFASDDLSVEKMDELAARAASLRHGKVEGR